MMEELRDAKGLTEEEFLEQYTKKNYPKPALTADIVIFSEGEAQSRQLLLIRRKNHPFIGRLALPGGFANPKEDPSLTAARELEEETGISGLPLKLIGIYGAPNRDPRGWVVSAAYAACVPAGSLDPHAGDDAAETLWVFLSPDANGWQLTTPSGEPLRKDSLAFDHAQIIQDAARMMF